MSGVRQEINLVRRDLASLRSPFRDNTQVAFDRAISAIEYATHPLYLRSELYPRQGTLLYLIFAQPETYTSYDLEVLDEWTTGATIADEDGDHYLAGAFGISPDVAARVEYLRSVGAPGFREIVFVGGRRVSKSFLIGVSASYRLHQFFADGDIHDKFAIDRDKPLFIPVMSGSFDRAKRDQFNDILKMVQRPEYVRKRLYVNSTASRLLLTTPDAWARSGRAGPPCGDA